MKPGADGGGDDFLNAFRERPWIGIRQRADPLANLDRARDTEERRRAERPCDRACGLERAVRLHREHDELRFADGVLVRGARGFAADLRRRRGGARRVARTDDHVVLAVLDEPHGERPAETAGPSEHRDSHAGAPAASSTAAARRREASMSLISVCVTTVRGDSTVGS